MILDEIVSIKKVGQKLTVDIEVDGPDSLFYCNGILTHNSAAGDTADITEENIQGGISKIQAADNVIGFIPNAQSREVGVLRAKFLKTRDSGGVGSYVDFKTDWKTLSFNPWLKEDGGGSMSFQSNAYSNLPSQKSENSYDKKSSGSSSYDKKPMLKKPSQDSTPKAIAKPNNEDVDADSSLTNEDDGEKKSTASVIKGIKGKIRPNAKKIKLQTL